MSVGSIALIEIKLNEDNQIDAREIHRIHKVHDFGVNSLHLKKCSFGDKIEFVMASGGDDQQLVIFRIEINNSNVIILESVKQ